jgi:hypothetical protein
MNDPIISTFPTIRPKIPIDHKAQSVVVSRWRASGKSIRAFARVHGLSERRLRRWCSGSESQKPDVAPVVPGFVEVRVARSPATAIEVVMGGGLVVRIGSGFDPVLLRAVVKALG